MGSPGELKQKIVEGITIFLDWVTALATFVAIITLIVDFSVHLSPPQHHLIIIFDLGVLAVFALDLLWRFLVAHDKKEFWLRNWLNLLVFIPFVGLFGRGLRLARLFFLVRQSVFFSRLFRKTNQLVKFLSVLVLQPARLMAFSFAMAILLGAFTLTLPAATIDGQGARFVDALFTAASATCVTGLVVQNTALYWTLFGQIVILFLIQIGGLGIMTFSISLAMALGSQLSRRGQTIMQDLLDYDTIKGVTRMLRFIVGWTVFVEGLGGLILFLHWQPIFKDTSRALYAAFFHSVSAFCNAGFSVFPDNLAGWRGDWVVNLIMGGLIIIGGLGFITFFDLRLLFGRNQTGVKKLRTQTKLVLITTAILLVVGTLAFYLLERNSLMAGFSPGEKILASFFQAVTPRTGGFNTIDEGKLSAASLFLTIVLMFIGASSGSTGGGIKTNTLALLFLYVRSIIRGKIEVQVFKTNIPYLAIRRAIAVFFTSVFMIFLVFTALIIVQPGNFLALMFETFSAYGTVGLSMGVTPLLNDPAKFLITLLMYIGRIGPLTIVLALVRHREKERYLYPEERIMVG